MHALSVTSEKVHAKRNKALLEINAPLFGDDCRAIGEQGLLIPVGLDIIALDFHSNRGQLLSIPVGIASSVLDSSWNQEQLLSIPVGIQSMCSRFQLESRAVALDSTWNREQVLSFPTCAESLALDFNRNREHGPHSSENREHLHSIEKLCV